MPADPLREQPKDLEAEKFILGSILMDQNALAAAVAVMVSDDFFAPRHALIFKTIKDMYRVETVDINLLRAKLTSLNLLNDAGGFEYLLELSEYSSAAPNIDAYVRLVREKAVLRSIIRSGGDIALKAYEQRLSAEDIIEEAEKQIYALSMSDQRNEPQQIGDVLQMVMADHADSASGNDKVVYTKYFMLDDMTTGFHPGELVIVAGRPSMGKSSLLLSMAVNVAMSTPPKNVAVFSLEMSKEQCAINMLCGLVKVEVKSLRKKGSMSKKDRALLLEGANQLSEYKIIIDDSVALSPAQLRSRARKLKSTFDIHAIFIDYMQLMQGDRERRWENRQQEVADISRGLKLLAKELQIPIIAGSQISREAETGKEMRPKLSQMRESGAIEQDADVVLMLYRDDYYNQNSKEPNIAEVIIGKQRHGPTGTVRLLFQREFVRFENTTSQ